MRLENQKINKRGEGGGGEVRNNSGGSDFFSKKISEGAPFIWDLRVVVINSFRFSNFTIECRLSKIACYHEYGFKLSLEQH